MGSEQVTCLAMGSPSLRFAGAEAEERRARERQRAVRTVVSGGAVSPRQPQYMNITIIFSGGVAYLLENANIMFMFMSCVHVCM